MSSRYSQGRISLCLCAFVANPILAKGKAFASQIFISTKTLGH